MAFEFKEDRLASNPVAYVQARGFDVGREREAARLLIERGARFPAHYLAQLGLEAPPDPRRHGVVACVVDAEGIGWVDRLVAHEARAWKARPGLPFDALELDAVLLAWLGADGEELAHVLPETRAFELVDELTTSIAGESMTIAAGLAIVEATARTADGARVPELGAVLSLVQRAGAAGLAGVACAAAKAAAFERECGRGTLCIVPAEGLEAGLLGALERAFDEVWAVRDLADLGRRLRARGWLTALAEVAPLDGPALDNVLGLLARLQRDDWQVARALGLAKRLRAAADAVGFAGDVATTRQRAVERARFAPLRYGAALESVVRDARAHVGLLGARGDTTHEERALAELDLAGALVVAWEFDATLQLVRGLAERVEVDPLAFAPRTRVRIWSQLGQALARRAGNEEACRAAFGRALGLAGELGAGEGQLARGFWIGALLSMGALDEAARELEAARGALRGRKLGRVFWSLDRADLARRRGEVWEDAQLDAVERFAEGHFWRPLGAYFAATARQPGRAEADRRARFGRAAEAFGAGIQNRDSGNRAYVALMGLGAAVDAEAWAEARAEVCAFAAEPFAAGFVAWFGERLGGLPAAGGEPGHAALEAVLDHDPYLLGRSNEREWGA